MLAVHVSTIVAISACHSVCMHKGPSLSAACGIVELVGHHLLLESMNSPDLQELNKNDLLESGSYRLITSFYVRMYFFQWLGFH